MQILCFLRVFMRDEVCFIFFFLCVLTVILLYVVHEYMINNKNNLSFRGGEKAEFAEHVSNSPTIAIRMRVETGWAGKRDRSISGVTRYTADCTVKKPRAAECIAGFNSNNNLSRGLEPSDSGRSLTANLAHGAANRQSTTSGVNPLMPEFHFKVKNG